MSDPRLGALLALGKGRMSGVRSRRWFEILQGMGCLQQRGFASDNRQGVTALAGRGAGKSFAMATKFDAVAGAHPNCSSVFIAFSADRARDILLPALWKLNEKHKIGLEERRGEKAMYWPNGYRLLFRGCSDRTECDKRRGTPWVMAGWDECASIAPGLLEYDIHECVEPRLVDFDGRWFTGGTPGPIQIGYWHKLSSGAAGYPVYEWDARSNPYINAMAFMLGVLQRMNAVPPREKWPDGCHSLMDIINTPSSWHLLPAKFVREYLGKWVQDLTSLIYKLTKRNSYRDLPLLPDTTTIGVDLGSFSDENPHLDHSAITVAQSHRTLPTLWLPKSYKLNETDVDILHVRLREELDVFKTASVHIDSASAGKIIETTFKKWGIPIRSAIKGPKLRRIQLMQSQVDNGNAQLHETECTALRAESLTLVWNDKRDNHSEACPDDGWDSALMASMPHLGDQDEPPPKEPEPGSAEWQQAQEMLEFERALEQAHDEAVGRVWG